MKIIVCAKQVPDTNEVKIDPVKGTLIREGVPSILNPDDANALEAALKLKDENEETTVCVVSMGPPQACYMLRECLAMGADEAYLLSDRAFGGADTCATSTTLAAAVKKLGGYDIVLAGRQAIDGDTAQVGPQLSQRLRIPAVTYVEDIKLEEGSAVVKRQLENGYEEIRVKTPCLLTAVKELNTPRYMSIGRIVEAYEKPITVWGHSDIGLAPEECGLKASHTQVLRSFTPQPKGKGKMLRGSAKEMTQELLDGLEALHVL